MNNNMWVVTVDTFDEGIEVVFCGNEIDSSLVYDKVSDYYYSSRHVKVRLAEVASQEYCARVLNGEIEYGD